MCQIKAHADSISNMSLRKTFAENIKYYRKEQGFSQQTLAEKCDIATNYLSEIERGQKFPSVEIIERLSRELNIPASLFFLEANSKIDDNDLIKKRNKEFSEKLINTVTNLLKEYNISN